MIVTDVDPKLAVHRSNNQNRDATPGQKAMATAMAFPEAKRGGDRKSSCFKQLDSGSFDKSLLSRARYVLRHTPTAEGQPYPQRCLDVMAGLLTLTEAYDLTQMEVKRQSKDDRLRKMATRIQARAIRRCGELLLQIEKGRTGPKPELSDGTVIQLNRKETATQAGLSERQRKTALRVDAGFKRAFLGTFKGGWGKVLPRLFGVRGRLAAR